MRILVVEDDVNLAAQLVEGIQSSGYCLLYTSPSPRD